MTITSNIRLFILILVLFSFATCTEKIEYPIEPYIEFTSFIKLNDGSGIDNRGILEFYYTDGDGDIGLYDEETQPPYDYNLIIKYFEQQNGEFKEVFITYFNEETQEIDTVSMNARIPILMPVGKNKAITGTIQDTLFINNYSSPFDTIRFEVYIVDRAFHESNTITTPPIIVKKE